MFKVSVKDFGPIIEGTVDLKPLTLFVGPSNAGKSYLAMLIYSLMKSSDASSIGGPISYDYFRLGRLARHRLALALGDIDEGVVKAIKTWGQSIEIGPQEVFEIPFLILPEEVQRLVRDTVEGLFGSVGQLFSGDLQRCHGNISDIRSRRMDATRLQIGLEQAQPRLILNFEEDEEDQGSLRVLPDAEWDMSQLKFPIRRGLARSLIEGASRRSRRSGNILEAYYDFFGLLMEIASATLFEKFPRSCYYLPAARSGIAQGHKAIASILVRQSSFAAIRPLEVPTLSGIITDFMGHILTMERAGGRHFRPGVKAVEEVVDFLETQVVRGKIDIERDREVTYPEISYAPVSGQPDTGKFPFHKTSSMVSELAPVILFLKYLVRPGDLVILEEPESHLHPAIQRQMARGIARLVNAGVKVIITTHSDYFIGQVNNLLKLSRASRQKREKEGYAAADCLKSDDVSAYHFRLDDNSGGSRVEELPILPDFGIDEQEFAAVSEALYEETISLQRIRAIR